MKPGPLVEMVNLKFSYPESQGFWALNVDSFQLRPGEKIFLAGPSGSGKTTFLEMIAGLLQPKEGKIQVLGHDFSVLSSQSKDRVRQKEMSFIFQNFNLVPYLTVEENILLPFWLGYRDERNQSQVLLELNRLLQSLRIEGLRSQRASQLSVGQSQRVAAARAFLKKPKLLLADEPTSALDADHRDEFLKILFEMSREANSSLIFVSHDKSLQGLFDRVIQVGNWS
jgi:putative ABC transport system ATP-binding protein